MAGLRRLRAPGGLYAAPMRRTSLGEWLKILGMVAVLVVLITRAPLILALAKPKDKPAPAACFTTPGAVGAALHRAPGPVRLEGARISDCFARSTDPGNVQQLGATVIGTATGLSDRANARPEGREALELGYLTGAVGEGAKGNQGLYENLRQRLEQESLALEGRSGAFTRGERAGRRTG